MMRSLLPVALLAGCLLGGKSHALAVRYFSPEPDRVVAPRAAPAVAQLRLGRVTASSHLRYRIVHRTSAVERELYETLRWTEQPDAYVRRSLLHALFDVRPLDRAIAGDVPTLDVEVVAFEEAPRHGGRVELRYELYDDHRVLAAGTVVEQRPAAGAEIEPVVAAIGTAMEAATATIAERVVERVAERRGTRSVPPQ